MQTSLSPQIASSFKGQQAESILRKCVHCGFCNATCPTYQLLGDELDGPRGRIYLIKQLLEGAEPNQKMQQHLDRCLTCRNCETTCPSGVKYGHLLDIGRQTLQEKMPRSPAKRLIRLAIAKVITTAGLFDFFLKTGRAFKFLLPNSLRKKIPEVEKKLDLSWPEPRHSRKMLVLKGCVQGSLTPNTNLVAANVLDRFNISLIEANGAGCCGAVDLHTTGESRAKYHARGLIDVWWPYVEQGIEAFVMTASGCGVTIKDYPALLHGDQDYIEKAKRIVSMTRDLVEVLDNEISQDFVTGQPYKRVAFHPPCSLQHGQKISGKVERLLQLAGYELCDFKDKHLCCGSAGTYSLLQPDLSRKLRENKLQAINKEKPDVVCTANIGCQTHLNNDSIAVKHWIELLL